MEQRIYYVHRERNREKKDSNSQSDRANQCKNLQAKRHPRQQWYKQHRAIAAMHVTPYYISETALLQLPLESKCNVVIASGSDIGRWEGKKQSVQSALQIGNRKIEFWFSLFIFSSFKNYIIHLFMLYADLTWEREFRLWYCASPICTRLFAIFFLCTLNCVFLFWFDFLSFFLFARRLRFPPWFLSHLARFCWFCYFR